jgi:4-alpha-glucanotransferase
MKILFNLEYRTNSGEQLQLCILNDGACAVPANMNTTDGEHWTCELALTAKTGQHTDYYYQVVRGDQVLRQEWQAEPHRLEFAAVRGANYQVYDHWIDIPEDAYLYSSAFTECVMVRQRCMSTKSEFARTIRLKVRAPQLRQDEQLAIVGAPEYLGAWDTERALPMTEHECHEWVVSLDADHLPGVFEFKFVILKAPASADAKGEILWEQCQNRFIDLPNIEKGTVVVYELPQAMFAIHAWKGAGTVIPIFSLRSEGSFGVGDFGDLKLMIDWCSKTRQRVLQILPINDTNMTGSWQDSYPYNSISIYALHPQYADLRQLPDIKDQEQREQFEQLRKELNALPQIDYERMFKAKLEYLRVIFKQEFARIKRTKAYKTFVDENADWLEPYAQFCVNRDKYGTAEFTKWPEAAAESTAEKTAETDFWHFVQYVLDQQMRAAHAHARAQRVVLKGDIPIGISRDGVEAWVEPRYFNLNGQAGAPPDAFAEDGQNWGFPTYNWDEMLADGCQWWVRRFRKMAQYFDAYRIDHVLGFFRIWEIPMPHKSGLYGQFQPSLPMSREEIEGRWRLPFREEFYLADHKQKDMWHPRINAPKLDAFKSLSADEQQRFWDMYNDYFYRRNNQFWYDEAMKKLPRLTQATRMLCCAEDLGMVPDCVPWVMNQLRILSLEIQSMPKDPSVRFGHLSRNPYRSVATISTHDMATLRQWWDEDPERTQDYYNTMLYRSGDAPHPLPGWLARDIVSRHLTSPSMLCLLSLQDWLSMDERLRLPDQNAERINIPANPRHYWRYRMHLTLEQLMEEDGFNGQIVELIANSGRK